MVDVNNLDPLLADRSNLRPFCDSLRKIIPATKPLIHVLTFVEQQILNDGATCWNVVEAL